MCKNDRELLRELQYEIAHLKEKIAEQAKVIDDLKAKLAKYENPHTPSSAQRFRKKQKPKKPKKLGAPKGHKGANRPQPEPDRIEEVTADHCESCGSTNLEGCGVEKKIIEEIPPPPRIEVIQFNQHRYRCRDCGHEFRATDGNCPGKGRFGVGMLTYLTMLKFSLRGVLRRIRDFTAHLNAFKISPKGIQDAIFRVAEACKNEYLRIVERVRGAPWNYMDETGMKGCGRNHWLWTFRTPDDEVVVVIRPSRGRDVLFEVFGNEIKNAGVADGWSVYKIFPVLQRCWAHLLREVDEFTDKSGGKELSEVIHEKFRLLRASLDKDPPPSMEERKEQKKVWDKEMEELVSAYSKFKELKKPLTYIRNGLGHWYTCLLYPGMEPTNNLSEQVIREHVLIRKIIGTFRSTKGAEYYQYIASLFATWRLQGKDVFGELDGLVRRELCGVR